MGWASSSLVSNVINGASGEPTTVQTSQGGHHHLTPWFCTCFCYIRRRALHEYDPPDLQASLASVAQPMDTQTSEVGQENISLSIQDRELADAKKKGLLVDIGGAGGGGVDEKSSPTSVLELDILGTNQQEMKELDQWDTARAGDDFCLEEEDSDDDLL
jgi:hypothetical protein